MKRAVWQRDRGRCAFVSPYGTRCTEHGQLEFDHAWPHGDGGAGTVDNVRLLCARHNQYQARQFFGLWTAEGGRESAAQYGSSAARCGWSAEWFGSSAEYCGSENGDLALERKRK